MSRKITTRVSWILVILLFLTMIKTALANRILDVARLENNIPNELIGMGLVVGLKGTGDGGDYLPAMRQLRKLLVSFGNPVVDDAELKNSNNVAIVHLSVTIPTVGVRAGELLDVSVSSVGASKSLRGGRLVFAPLFSPDPSLSRSLQNSVGSASGNLTITDDSTPTNATIHLGAAMIRDVLPEEIKDGIFTLVLHPNTANMETATAVAARINEEVSPQTDGLPVAVAVDATSVDVTIPKVELSNTTAFISRIRSLPLPNIPIPATVIISEHSKDMILTGPIEIAPTTVSQGNMVVVISPGQSADPADPNIQRPTMASIKDLVDAFNLLKISSQDRIDIVKQLYDANALKAELRIEP